jgi:integrase
MTDVLVPMIGAKIDLQSANSPARSPSLFPSRGGKPLADIKKSWAVICRNAGQADLRIHDLRRGFASLLASSGLGLPSIGALLGHSRADTTHRYVHLADDPLRQATAKVGQMIKNAGG